MNSAESCRSGIGTDVGTGQEYKLRAFRNELRRKGKYGYG